MALFDDLLAQFAQQKAGNSRISDFTADTPVGQGALFSNQFKPGGPFAAGGQVGRQELTPDATNQLVIQALNQLLKRGGALQPGVTRGQISDIDRRTQTQQQGFDDVLKRLGVSAPGLASAQSGAIRGAGEETKGQVRAQAGQAAAGRELEVINLLLRASGLGQESLQFQQALRDQAREAELLREAQRNRAILGTLSQLVGNANFGSSGSTGTTGEIEAATGGLGGL